MEIRVTPEAAEILKEKAVEKGGNYAVRVYVAGMG
jgi:RNA polymerase subunit RPABC4/transcription elongation factor Spt4